MRQEWTLAPHSVFGKWFYIPAGRAVRVQVTLASQGQVAVVAVDEPNFERMKSGQTHKSWGDERLTYYDEVFAPKKGGRYFVGIVNYDALPVKFTYRFDETVASPNLPRIQFYVGAAEVDPLPRLLIQVLEPIVGRQFFRCRRRRKQPS